METLESSRVCRLCGKKSGMCIDIFDKNENHVRKINAVLPILVHEMDMLPKQMCHGCNYKLGEFHKFYMNCLKTDADLKSQLSWMRKGDSKEEIIIPMVQIENLRIKSEPPDYDIYELDPVVENVNYINSMSTMTFPISPLKRRVIPRTVDNITEQFTYNSTFANCERCNCSCDTKGRTKAAYSVDCTKTRPRRKLYRNIGITGSVSPSRNGRSAQENITENNVLKDTRKHIIANESSEKSSMNTFEHQASKFHHKRAFKETASLSTDNILNTDEVKVIEIKTERSDDVEIRSLRPRKGSVDYVGTKRKINSRTNSEKRSRSAEVKQTDVSIPEINMPPSKVNGVNVAVENSEDGEPRSLRSRKNCTHYLGPKRKDCHLRTHMEQRTRSEESRCKKHKPSNVAAVMTNPCSKLSVSDAYSETIEAVIKQEIVDDFEEPTPTVQVNTERKKKVQTKGCVRNLSESFDTLTKKLSVIEKKNIPASAVKKGNQTTSSSKSNNKLKSLTKATKNKLRSGKVVIKRITTKNIRSSPKYLRSQDIGHLRNGKIKKLDSDRSSIKRLKQKLEKIGVKKSAVSKKLPIAIKQNVNVMNVPTILNTVDHYKLFCEKCCAYFAHKELFRLHPCYDNKVVCSMK